MSRDSFSKDIIRMEEELDSIVQSAQTGVALAAGSTGKLRRGKLVLILGEMLGRPEGIVTAAAAGEAIHLATLIHDDVLDRGKTRRGAPSLFQKLGAARAILYGDLIFSRAILAVNNLKNWELSNLLLDTIKNLCAGELLANKLARKFPWAKDSYFKIAQLKTSSLFEYSCLAPGLMARVSGQQQKVLKRFGTNLGICYQIVDDCLDFSNRTDQTGKDSLSDLRNGVPNFVLIMAGKDSSLKENLIRAINKPTETKLLCELAHKVREKGFFLKALSLARDYLEKSRRECKQIKNWGYQSNTLLIDQYLKEQSEFLDKVEKL